jgi:hypothetical protein
MEVEFYNARHGARVSPEGSISIVLVCGALH